jgi:hypothetical protein
VRGFLDHKIIVIIRLEWVVGRRVVGHADASRWESPSGWGKIVSAVCLCRTE